MGRELCSAATGLRILAGALSALAVSSCTGGGSGGETLVPGPDPPASAAQAARFLTRTTFGPTEEELHRLSVIGYTAWFTDQEHQPVSLERPTLEAWDNDGQNVSQNQRQEMWWWNALEKKDQLRQRMAFALSEICVISDVAGALGGDPIGMAEYQDILARNALGNYRTLLEDVTKSPAMGKYLNTLKNQKADPLHNIHPDENYAREVMQLFSLGLVQLNPDGTPILDVDGHPVPTYDQGVVEGFAAVFTGWNFANANSWEWAQENFLPMQAWEGYHEPASKSLLDGVVSPANLTAQQDLTFALDLIFHHPNVGPFIGKQLIKRLVTSNPSPEYVQRIATVFADDGSGVRGNLFAVAKAIVMDPEAVSGNIDHPGTFGKVREPLLRATALWRAMHAVPHGPRFSYWNPENDFGQAALRASSVFNFFSPAFQPGGEIHDAGLVAPEFQITTETRITSGTNRFYECTFEGYPGYPYGKNDTPILNISAEQGLAHDPAALVERLDRLLMCGGMSQEMRDIVVSMVTDTDATNTRQRVLEALYLIVTSPEFAVQK